jgi:hypothetical protein
MRKPLWALPLVSLACNGGAPHLPSPTDAGADAGPSPSADSGATQPDAGISRDGGRSATGPRGVYAATGFSPIAGGGPYSSWLNAALSLPYVDGFLLQYKWADLERDAGELNWQVLDSDLRLVADAGKRASIGIAGGLASPAWLCEAPGANCIPLVYQVVIPGNAGACTNALLPPPWEANYQNLFESLQSALSQHLLDAGYWGLIDGVKISGINSHDDETALPFSGGGRVPCSGGAACDAGYCELTDAVAAMEQAGFSDTTAVSAFVALGQAYRTSFPGLTVGSQVSASMPDPTPGTDLAFAMVQALIAAEPPPLTVQDNGLTARTGIDPGTAFARDAGLPVGFQMLQSVYSDPTCEMGNKGLPPDAGVKCDEAVLIQAIDNGVMNAGAQWLEFFPQDLVMYPDAGAYAHHLLAP